MRTLKEADVFCRLCGALVDHIIVAEGEPVVVALLLLDAIPEHRRASSCAALDGDWRIGPWAPAFEPAPGIH